jgi:hypothetical protein
MDGLCSNKARMARLPPRVMRCNWHIAANTLHDLARNAARQILRPTKDCCFEASLHRCPTTKAAAQLPPQGCR